MTEPILVAHRKPTHPMHLFGYMEKEITFTHWQITWVENGKPARTVIENTTDLIIMNEFATPDILALKSRFETARRWYFEGKVTETEARQCHQDWVNAAKTKYPNFNRRFIQDM